MGIIDIFKGKKGKGEAIVLEPSEGGFTVQGTAAKEPGISAAMVFFDAGEPVEDEHEVLLGLIDEFSLASKLVPGTKISIAHEILPEIDEFIDTQEMPDSLNTFLMSRVMLAGLARGPAEMAKLAISPFDHKGVKGVLVLKEA